MLRFAMTNVKPRPNSVFFIPGSGYKIPLSARSIDLSVIAICRMPRTTWNGKWLHIGWTDQCILILECRLSPILWQIALHNKGRKLVSINMRFNAVATNRCFWNKWKADKSYTCSNSRESC